MDHPEEEIIIDNDEGKCYHVINEEEVDYTGVRISIIESRTL